MHEFMMSVCSPSGKIMTKQTAKFGVMIFSPEALDLKLLGIFPLFIAYS